MANENKNATAVDMSAVEEQIKAMLEMAKKTTEDMIADAKKEAEEIISAAKQNVPKVVEQASGKREVKPEPKVKIKLHKDNKLKDDLPVSVNGTTWLIQRGVFVEVPLSVKEVIDNSQAQEEYAIAFSEGLSDEYDRKFNN